MKIKKGDLPHTSLPPRVQHGKVVLLTFSFRAVVLILRIALSGRTASRLALAAPGDPQIDLTLFLGIGVRSNKVCIGSRGFASGPASPRARLHVNKSTRSLFTRATKTQRTKRAQEVLTEVGLADRMDHRPNQLSGGQRQRVAVGRALVNKPSIILADEPTGNLDSKTSLEIMALFDAIHAQGNTVIVVTHEEEVAQHAHRVIRLRDGLVESDIRIK